MDPISAFCMVVAIHQTVLEPTVQQLGSTEFRVREKAHKWLDNQLKVPWEEFLAVGLRKKSYADLETQLRVRYLTRKMDDICTDYGQYPWICALPKEYPNREKLVIHYLSFGSCLSQPPDYEGYRYATFLFLHDLKEKGWWASSLRKLQIPMIENEKYWRLNSRYP